jgi:hypothetical protein
MIIINDNVYQQCQTLLKVTRIITLYNTLKMNRVVFESLSRVGELLINGIGRGLMHMNFFCRKGNDSDDI